jgi:hypothetical protein
MTRREDYYRFHEIQVECRDMDPAYPVLSDLARTLGLQTEDRLWLVLVFTAYYHLGSALSAFDTSPLPTHASTAARDLPCATERRGHWHRPRLARHLSAVQEIARGPGGLTGWLVSDLNGTPEENWRQVQHRAGLLPGNGRWASFKTTELVKEILGLELHAPDMQHAHSSGPRKGLELLHPGLPTGNGPADVDALDRLSAQLVTNMRRRGVKVAVETAETSLCDFHSMASGRYYPGHDIDQMQLQLDSVKSALTDYAWRARRRVLPEHYLGEVTGRSGLDRQAMVCYRTTGRIPVRDTSGELR